MIQVGKCTQIQAKALTTCIFSNNEILVNSISSPILHITFVKIFPIEDCVWRKRGDKRRMPNSIFACCFLSLLLSEEESESLLESHSVAGVLVIG